MYIWYINPYIRRIVGNRITKYFFKKILINAFHLKQELLQTIDVISYIYYVDSEEEIQQTTLKTIKIHECPL